jgi:hypothetical protein
LRVVFFDKTVNPETFNDDANVTILLKFELPLTFDIPLIVVLLDNVVNPETFNDDTNVVLLDNVVNPETFNDDSMLFYDLI